MNAPRNCTGCGRAPACEGWHLCLACLLKQANLAVKGVKVQSPSREKVARPKVRSNEIAEESNRTPEDARTLAERLDARRPEWVKQPKSKKSKGMLACARCGQLVPRGEILQHKIDVHNERPLETVLPSKGDKVWTPVVSGGLPGLGKRRR